MKKKIKKIKNTPAVEKYNKLRKEFKKYFQAMGMLIKDAYQLDKKRCIAIIVTSAAGVSMLGFSLGVLLKYVKMLESDSTHVYFGYSIHVRDGLILGLVSFTVMVFLVLSAGMLLYARLKTRDLLVDFNLEALANVAEKYGWAPPDPIAWINDATLKSNIKSLYSGDPKRASMAARRFFEGIQHFVTALGGLIVLLWLDAAATFYLVVIIVLSMFFYRKINKRAASSTVKQEDLSGESSRRSRALLDNMASCPNPDFNPAMLRSITHEGLIKDYNRMYFDRFATRSMTEFLSYVLTGFALGFLVFTLGHSAIKGEKSWAAVVGYIVILKTVMQAVKTILKMFTAVARQYPGISRLHEFNKKSANPPSELKTNELKLALTDGVLTDKNEKIITLEKGDIISISAPVTLSRYSVRFFEKVLAMSGRKRKKKSHNIINSIAIAVPLEPLPVPVTLKEFLGIPEETGAAELRKGAGSLAGKIEKIFPLEPDSIVTQKDLKKLSAESLNRLSLLSCSVSDRPIILVHSSLVNEEWLQEKRDMLKNRILVVCNNGLPEKQISGKNAVKIYFAAAADCEIVAAGSFSFMKKRKAAINKQILEREQLLISKSTKVVILTGTEDDDDDEE